MLWAVTPWAWSNVSTVIRVGSVTAPVICDTSTTPTLRVWPLLMRSSSCLYPGPDRTTFHRGNKRAEAARSRMNLRVARGQECSSENAPSLEVSRTQSLSDPDATKPVGAVNKRNAQVALDSRFSKPGRKRGKPATFVRSTGVGSRLHCCPSIIEHMFSMARRPSVPRAWASTQLHLPARRLGHTAKKKREDHLPRPALLVACSVSSTRSSCSTQWSFSLPDEDGPQPVLENREHDLADS